MMYQRHRVGGEAMGKLVKVLLVACFCLISSPLLAQGTSVDGAQGPKAKVFLLPVESARGEITPIVTDRIGESIRERLRADGRIELLGTYRDIQRQLDGSGQHASASIAEAERLYTSGIGLLTAGENQRAAETFQRSVDMMEQNIADLQNYEVLADAMVNLSLAYYLAGFDLDSRKYMNKFVHLRPDSVLDAEKFPEELLAVAKDEQERVKKAGPGKLVVTANVAGAIVMVDGVMKGETPVTIEDVGFGSHYVVVRNSKGAWSEEVRVRGRRQSQEVVASLSDDGGAPVAAAGSDGYPSFYVDMRETIRSGEFGDDLQPYMRELVSRTGAQYVTWVVVVREGSAYMAVPFVYRAQDHRFVRVEATRFNIELSNLRVGINRMSDLMITAIHAMPEDQVFSAVNLVPEPVAVVAPKPAAQSSAAAPVAAAPVQTPPASTAQPVIPPPLVMGSEEKSNTWKYVGWTGAAVLVAGAVVGSVFLIANMNDDSSKPVGFEAEVSW